MGEEVMVPKQAPPPSATTTTTQPFPPLTRSTTLPAYNLQSIATDRTLLAPEDAIHQGSPPCKQSAAVNKLKELRMTNGLTGDLRLSRRGRHGDRTISASRRKKGTWKKLLWVKQSYPDNYTDQDTFLEHLQRNPRLQPYDFWPLVADSTVIVQHVCSVIIFIVCFVGIYTERVSPGAIVGWGSIGTFLGWLLWDWWVGQEESQQPSPPIFKHEASASSSLSNLNPNPASMSTSNLHNPSNLARHSHSASASSIQSVASATQIPTPRYVPNYPSPGSSPSLSPRTSLRLFPVFRRYAKQRSWRGHMALTTLLVVGAGGGVGLILGRGGDGEGVWDFPWKSGLMGVFIGVFVTGLAMGGCSWWLIGLQKYKNEIHGPWDPARPIIRRHYDY